MNGNAYQPPAAYLRRCMWLSLRKRALYVAFLALLGGVVATLLGWPGWGVAVLSLAAGGGYAAWAMADSWERHSHDVVLGDAPGVTEQA